MRILQLCNRVPYPLMDGGAIAMFAMTKSLADAGCEVVTLAINTKKHWVDESSLPSWFTEKTKLYTVAGETNVTKWGALSNLFSTSSYNLIRFDIPEFHEKLKKLLQQYQFDIVQLEGLFLSMYIPTIRANSKAIIALRAHNIEHLIWKRMADNTSSIIKKWYLNLLTQRLKKEEIATLNAVDCIIPISEIDAEAFRNLGAKVPMLVCTAGVDDKLLNSSQAMIEKNTLFHLAAMNWQPNVQANEWLLNEVWPTISKKFPEVILHLAGKDMPDYYFSKQNNQLQVSGSIANAHEFMLSKNIMLVPLLSGSGMRIKIIEGLALGKVIVTTSIGAEGIACKHKLNILIADTAKEFISSIEWALTNPEACLRISVEAKNLVRQTYTNKKIVENLIQFYNHSIESSKHKSA